MTSNDGCVFVSEEVGTAISELDETVCSVWDRVLPPLNRKLRYGECLPTNTRQRLASFLQVVLSIGVDDYIGKNDWPILAYNI